MKDIREIETWLDGVPSLKKKGKRGRITKKALAVVIGLSLIMISASATLLTYFNQIDTTINVEQAISIDGMPMGEIITHEIEEAYGGCCYCFPHNITNDGCQGYWLDWEHWAEPTMEGIHVLMIERCYLLGLDINALDGIANDSFDVYVDGVHVYTYTDMPPVNDPETWQIHAIDLTPFNILCSGTRTVTINATGPQWSGWQTYGQLGIDNISLWCDSCCGLVLCDSVDIGKPASEAGHNLQDWGPIEPATSGGNWGGIDDCRATWTSHDNYRWASVDFICDYCNCCEAVCEKAPMELPFYIGPGETIYFCLCYNLDPLIMPGTYIVHSKLVPA